MEKESVEECEEAMEAEREREGLVWVPMSWWKSSVGSDTSERRSGSVVEGLCFDPGIMTGMLETEVSNLELSLERASRVVSASS